MQTEEILEKLKEYKAERGDAYGIETLGFSAWQAYRMSWKNFSNVRWT